ncbi:MAG: primosomal protein N' [Dehalococcoidia bacterium]|nr:primosomal protein N' [Dehalococcoidia bacterium]
MKYAQIAVNAPTAWPRSFTYAIPSNFHVFIGSAVWVPFGKRLLQGIVLNLTDQSPVEETKPIAEVIDSHPFLSEAQVELAGWISRHYLSPLFESAALMLPPGFERRVLTFIEALPNTSAEAIDVLTPMQKKIYDFLLTSGRLDVRELKKQVPQKQIEITVNQLTRKGLILKTTELERARISPKFKDYVTLSIDSQKAYEEASRLLAARKAPKQADLLKFLMEAGEPVPIARAKQNAKCSDGVIKALVDDGLIQKAKIGKTTTLKVISERASEALNNLRGEKGDKQWGEVLLLLNKSTKPLTTSEVRAKSGAPLTVIQEMEEKGWVSIEHIRLTRDPLTHRTFSAASPPKLTPDQESAWSQISRSLQKEPGAPSVFLLHGITGSGKTEIYLRALEQTIALGKKAIVLVPEIALTPQTVDRFASRFPDRVAVIHSKLSPGEQFDEWQRIREGEFDVVIGSRSALFVPQPDLGLIVIDEEHEWTYKQHDKTPLYHARDAALKLAELVGAVVILGSATPDLESYHRAKKGDYRLLELPNRVGEFHKGAFPSLPQVEIIDLRQELKSRNRSIFSRKLTRAINSALDLHEQVILFLNRRGTASFVQCRDCGHVMRCRRCEITLTHHESENSLICHQCNYRIPPPTTCPECWSRRIKFLGIGTQKVEEETAKAFPRARLLRWDRDVTQGKYSHEEILKKFQDHQADILIGTQMVAKGLDIPLVTLVGVVNADVSLHLPHFSAGERTFQLLSQVAGRAGRGRRAGQVIIQTYSPGHYAILAAARQDYNAFYEQEIIFRQQYGNPPFNRLASLVYAHTNAKRCQEEAEKMANSLREERDSQGLANAAILGPVPAYIQRLRGRYRWQVMVRSPDPLAILSRITIGQGWTADIDPAGMG